MKVTTIQNGQTEIGIIEHDGREFAAMGSSVVGRHVAGYLMADRRGNLSLRRFDGRTMLECRAEIVREYHHEWNEPVAVVFSLTSGRFIVGYAHHDKDGLFRGELIEADSLPEAREAAIAESERWIEIDADDEERFQYELSLEDADDDSEDD